MKTASNEFKFRAECLNDVVQFINKIMEIGDFSKLIIDDEDSEDELWFPDCEVEITTHLNYDRMLDVMRKIPDSHTMMQTLKLKLNYTGIRDHDII